MPYSLKELNQMDQAAFTTALGAVFEATPAIATQTWHQRPFASLAALHHCLVHTMQTLPPTEQLALIQAHPDLGSRVQMAVASQQEQAAAGLDQLTPEERDRFFRLNQTYRTKFQFPFIMAVADQRKEMILQAFSQRLENTQATEIQQALLEISQIAWFRLQVWVVEP